MVSANDLHEDPACLLSKVLPPTERSDIHKYIVMKILLQLFYEKLKLGYNEQYGKSEFWKNGPCKPNANI